MYTRILKPFEDKNAISEAAEILKNGGLAAIPTETVYGLAANALDAQAVSRIFEAKGRPSDNPLIVHISDFNDIYEIAETGGDKRVKMLAEAFWPGALTMVLPKKDIIPGIVSGNLPTVGVRMPSHNIAREIIRACALPLAAPSANISGFPSPVAFEHVFDDMNGRVEAIVDGGDCEIGLESTVLSLCSETAVILRPGGVTLDMISRIIGKTEVHASALQPIETHTEAASPGMKYKHYSPKAKITVVKATLPQFIEYVKANMCDSAAVLCFEGEQEKMPCAAISFGSEKDYSEQARRLFSALRELDLLEARRVYARCPSSEGIGLAVCNRLFRAAGFDVINS